MEIFKLNGIYARILDSEKQTYFGGLLNAFSGEKDEPVYEIVYFAKNDRFNDSDYKKYLYCADHSFMSGEIFSIADWQKKRYNSYAKFKNVSIIEEIITFENDEFLYRSHIEAEFLNLSIFEKSTGKSSFSQLRFIPWNNNFL